MWRCIVQFVSKLYRFFLVTAGAFDFQLKIKFLLEELNFIFTKVIQQQFWELYNTLFQIDRFYRLYFFVLSMKTRIIPSNHSSNSFYYDSWWPIAMRKATTCHKRQLAISDKSRLESKGDNLPQVDRGDKSPQKGGATTCHNN